MPGLTRQAHQDQQHRFGERFAIAHGLLYDLSHNDILNGQSRVVKAFFDMLIGKCRA